MTQPLPQLAPHPNVDQVADFIQAYMAMDTQTLAAAIVEKYPFLDHDCSDRHAIITGWYRGQMEYAAVALREYVIDRELAAILRGAA